jgi:transcriptional antiterminator
VENRLFYGIEGGRGMKTIKQMAEELGVSKMRVYRLIKEQGYTEAEVRGAARYYSEQTEQAIKSHFLQKTLEDNTLHGDARRAAANEGEHHTQLLQILFNELEQKNKQIDALNEALANARQMTDMSQQIAETALQTAAAAQKTAEQAQALHAATIQTQMIESAEKKPFFKRLFKKGSGEAAG